MDIKQLKFLIALDETRHFGQAAARCHVTQPTLSMRLRQLEDELGLELVRRGQRFEGFSAEGERILAWARSLLAAQDGLLAEAAACRGHLVGTLRLGVVPLASFDPMRLISLFAERHPGLRFQLHALSSDQILEGLVRNQLDLGLSYLDRLDREHFASLELAEARMGLLYDQRHFHFVSSSLRWEQLANLPLGLLSTGMHFRQSIDHSFRARGLSPQVRLEADAVHHLTQAVSAGLCCSVMPLPADGAPTDGHLRLLPIEDAHTLAPQGLIMRRGAPASPLAQACFEEAREWLANA
ncbi:LysR family transcriptional regulator [Pseudomonas chengduensis]|uniref:DNA-binding transcriptional regulator, LysR family n=1 Tax=Ectopseudomonas chengduensis TaxID=489632 RepID=A0A1G6J8Q7_9GAMM|nr:MULTISPECIES: LysR family transcriptional regulator [Pseudomonas]KQO44527.1 LysR family transcriptional regulator [Pseudomonas sp. Leaf83]MBP3060154.1 LysR family transcriptional regulator [Pseudomonas chengduensis]MDH0622597.1 LysR family transcriptional regulator [Pseudomonas chengduensis]MDH0956736.1 LysR family transcriptional regulator [Pseudomonas chengduensis]MDH1534787.1 LysR family transcriptional regulator [Pseudomonas chengduensis]